MTSSASISLTSSFCSHACARLPYFMRCARSHAAEAVSAKTRRRSLQEKSGPEKRKWSSCAGRRIFAPGDRLTQKDLRPRLLRVVLGRHCQGGQLFGQEWSCRRASTDPEEKEEDALAKKCLAQDQGGTMRHVRRYAQPDTPRRLDI